MIPTTHEPASAHAPSIASAWARQNRLKALYGWGAFIAYAVIIVVGLRIANEANAGGFLRGLDSLFDFVSGFWLEEPYDFVRALLDLDKPDDSPGRHFPFEAGRVTFGDGALYIPEIPYELFRTVNIAVLATLIGAGAGFAFSFLASVNLVPRRWIRLTARRFMDVSRAFPEIVIALLLSYLLGVGAIGAVIAIAVHTAGALGKLFSEVAENADLGPFEGLTATGASWVQCVRYAIVPQVMPNYLSYALLRLEINIRASTLLTAVGEDGFGMLLRLAVGRNNAAQALALIVVLYLTIMTIDHVSAHLRDRLSRGIGHV